MQNTNISSNLIKRKIVVGVNEFVEENEKIDIPILQISKKLKRNRLKRLKELKNFKKSGRTLRNV